MASLNPLLPSLRGLWLVALLAACSSSSGENPAPATDAGTVSDTPGDAPGEVRADSGVDVPSTPDTGSVDAGAVDTGSVDTGSVDTGSVDTGAADAGGPDAAAPDVSTADVSAFDGGTAGQYCGGDLGRRCAPGLFCDYLPMAYCGATDAPGMCHPVPFVCPAIVDPVCGCDGVTYGNSCLANRAGQGVLHRGMCVPPDCHITSCPAGQYCAECRTTTGATWVCLATGSAC